MSSLSRPYLGTRLPSMIDKTGAELPELSGIFVGVVKKVDNTTRTGRLWVYITQLGGPEPDKEVNWKLVSYASPFFGQTTGPEDAADYRPAKDNQNFFQQTSQSYGFFMVPPDIGNKVLCCFVPGSTEGYWFACINKNSSAYMTPAIGSVDYNLIDQYSIRLSGLTLDSTKKYPVGDWNENLQKGYSKPTEQVAKPLHVPRTIQLFNQGLDADPIRGAITSSSQRDTISSVFGISTPGRPLGSQDQANDPNIETRLISGDYNPNSYKVTNRVGGHTFVMDDGDIKGDNNLVRLRTSKGHQILMYDDHENQDVLYISNSRGTAWVELTAEGDVLIYGANDFALRTSGNIMMHSDRNISFYAKQNINLASTNVNTEAQVINQTAVKGMSIYGKKIQARSGSTLDIASTSSLSIRSGGRIAINGSAIALNGSGSSPNIQNPPALPKFNLPDVQAGSNGPARKWQVVPGKIVSTNYKVPTHEPYLRKGLQQAIQESVAAANVYTTDIEGNPISPSIIAKPAGPDAAAQLQLYDRAPESEFISQPEPDGAIGELSTADVRALNAQIAWSESRGDYTKIEENGYVGKYQFSYDNLVELGYVKEGLPPTIETINNPNNWVSKDNLNNLDEFLAAKELQEQAMLNLVKANYATLQATGAIVKSSSKEQIAGLLSVAHLAGPGGATTWWKTGKYNFGGNGYTAADYYNRGKFSVTQAITNTEQ